MCPGWVLTWGLYTQQSGTLEEVSHRSQRVVLMQGTARQLIG